MESLNPSGTGKDRAVQYMLRQAKLHPNYGPGVRIVEGTSGSTGIALAFQCNALQVSGAAEHNGNARLQLHIVMPDDQADEKKALLEKLGAQVLVTPCCSISNKDHYVNRARRLAQELDAQGHWAEEEEGAGTERSAGTAPRRRRVGGAIFMDQFENEANFQAHYCGTGPELWRQMGRLSVGGSSSGAGAARPQRRMDAFVMSAGTGGTIAGVSRYVCVMKCYKPR
jgi:cysteine synthase A